MEERNKKGTLSLLLLTREFSVFVKGSPTDKKKHMNIAIIDINANIDKDATRIATIKSFN